MILLHCIFIVNCLRHNFSVFTPIFQIFGILQRYMEFFTLNDGRLSHLAGSITASLNVTHGPSFMRNSSAFSTIKLTVHQTFSFSRLCVLGSFTLVFPHLLAFLVLTDFQPSAPLIMEVLLLGWHVVVITGFIISSSLCITIQRIHEFQQGWTGIDTPDRWQTTQISVVMYFSVYSPFLTGRTQTSE